MALFSTEVLNPGVQRRELLGWAMYDFANSGYTTVVITAVFAAATFDAALRVVRSRLAIAILPAELSAPYAEAFELRVTPLTDAWAQRRFAIACRDPEALTPAARLLVEHLVAAAKAAG